MFLPLHFMTRYILKVHQSACFCSSSRPQMTIIILSWLSYHHGRYFVLNSTQLSICDMMIMEELYTWCFFIVGNVTAFWKSASASSHTCRFCFQFKIIVDYKNKKIWWSLGSRRPPGHQAGFGNTYHCDISRQERFFYHANPRTTHAIPDLNQVALWRSWQSGLS